MMESTDEYNSSDSSVRGSDGCFRVETGREGPIILDLLISQAIIIELQHNNPGHDCSFMPVLSKLVWTISDLLILFDVFSLEQ